MATPLAHADLRARLSGEVALSALTAGRAVVSLRSQRTGEFRTYRVSKFDTSPHFSVDYRVVAGLNRDDDGRVTLRLDGWTRIGILYVNDEGVPHRFVRNMKTPVNSITIDGFHWMVDRLVNKTWDDEKAEIWHEGQCCKCGRRLTDPESIRLALGPICRGR